MPEAIPPLASSDDVAAALGRALTPEEIIRVPEILAKASELFRLHSKQLFTPGRSQTRLKVDGGEVNLPQRPVTTVHTVTDRAGNPVTWTRFKQILTVPLRSDAMVIVDYSHGAEVVPELVRTTVAEVAKKVVSIAPDATRGLTSTMRVRGPFTTQESYATWAQGGQTMLAPDDLAIALSFRRRLGHTIVPS